MGLRMATPWEHPTTRVYYLRERVPLDLADQVKGRKVSLSVAGRVRQVTLGETVKVSLGTKEPKVAKDLYKEASAAVQEMWGRFRQEAATGPVRLTGKQVEALAGHYYRDIIRAYGDDPGPPGDGWFDGIDTTRDLNKKGRERAFGEDADRLLIDAGLAVDVDSRTRLLDAIARANIQAHQVLERRAEGDFSPDPKAGRFPELQSPTVKSAPPPSAETVTLSDLFDLWKADHLLRGSPEKTVRDFRQKLDSLIAFVGHEDAQRVEARQIADWTEHLRHGEKLSAQTVGQKYLVAIKRIFTVGKRKFRISENPAADVVVEVPKAKRTRSPGFSDAEAKTVLSAALTAPELLHRWSQQNRRAIRWAPWLCAYNGARITEMMQLRKRDVEWHGDIPCLRITPEAASTKTGNFRLVPIHTHLVEMGFLDFVQSRPDGYVFFDLKPGQNAKTRAQSIGVKVRDWVRDVVKIEDPRLQPNHGWRHRFKTVAREVGIPPAYIDAIQGHEDGRASADYGDFTAKLLAPEIAKLPRYDVGP